MAQVDEISKNFSKEAEPEKPTVDPAPISSCDARIVYSESTSIKNHSSEIALATNFGGSKNEIDILLSPGNTGQTLTEFHLFNKLPLEVRLMIWRLTVTPRLVEPIPINYTFKPVRALQICQESRVVLEKKYEKLSVKTFFGSSINNHDGGREKAQEYLWGPRLRSSGTTNSFRIDPTNDVLHFGEFYVELSSLTDTMPLILMKWTITWTAALFPHGWGSIKRIAFASDYRNRSAREILPEWSEIFAVVLAKAKMVEKIFIVWPDHVDRTCPDRITSGLNDCLSRKFDFLHSSAPSPSGSRLDKPALQFIKAPSTQENVLLELIESHSG